jgi:hypothetical protein
MIRTASEQQMSDASPFALCATVGRLYLLAA